MMEQDKLIERERYDARAQSQMAGAVTFPRNFLFPSQRQYYVTLGRRNFGGRSEVYCGLAINLERLAEK